MAGVYAPIITRPLVPKMEQGAGVILEFYFLTLTSYLVGLK